MKSMLLVLALSSVALPLRAESGADLSKQRADLLTSIETSRTMFMRHTTPPDALTARFEPRLDLIKADAEAAPSAQALASSTKAYLEWKGFVVADILANLPPKTSAAGAPRASVADAARPAVNAPAFQRNVKPLASLADASPQSAGRYYDGSTGRLDALRIAEAESSDGVPAALYAESDPRHYAKLRALVIAQGADPRVVDAAIAEGIAQKVDPTIILSVIWKESTFDPRQRNHSSGATGLMQVLPETARDMGVRGNLYDIRNNIRAGVRYLSWIANDYFDMNVDLSKAENVAKGKLTAILASYNAGVGNVTRWLRKQGNDLVYIPFTETRDYVTRISQKILEWL